MSRNGRIVLVAAAVAAAVAAFVLLRSGNDNGKKESSASGGSESTVTSQAPGTATARRIAVKGGKPVNGVQKISVTKGDTLRLIVSSPDTSQEIHVHGYELKRDMAPGRPASFEFDTDKEGVFEIELEDTATQIASLQVRPG